MALAPAPGVAADTIAAADSLAMDSIAARSLAKGIVLYSPPQPEVRPLSDSGNGMSWVLTGLFLLFVLVCLRFRKNSRYFSLMLHDVTSMRERHNAFDDTVRETTFLWLLNVLWCGAAGVLLYGVLSLSWPGLSPGEIDVGRLGICIGVAMVYTVFLTAAYAVVGNLFSDGAKASLWVKGYLSIQGLEALTLFPLALLALCVPAVIGSILTAAAIVFILAKLLFIYKGFCIFFSRIASWVLFLYYLCSLEIVPIVLTYLSGRYLYALV